MDPNKLGPTKLFFGEATADYYELRAIELIIEMRTNKEKYEDLSKAAITFLAIARAKREKERTTT